MSITFQLLSNSHHRPLRKSIPSDCCSALLLSIICLLVVFNHQAFAAQPQDTVSYESSIHAGKVIINEINKSESYVEFYVNETVDVTNWTLYYNGKGNIEGSVTICSSSCTYTAGTFWVLAGVPLHNNLQELLLLDNDISDANVKAVHYFRYANNAQSGGDWEWETDDPDISTLHDVPGNVTNLCSMPDGNVDEGQWQECGSSEGGSNEEDATIAKYQLEEASWSGGGSILDSSGKNNNASPVGNIVSTVDNPISCQAADIPYNTDLATRDAINTGVNANTLGDTGSIAFWYRSDSAWGDISEAKVLFDASTSSAAQFLMYIWPGGYLEFEATEPDGDRAERYIQKSFSADEWVHIAVTWDAINDEVKIYVNGVSQTLTDHTGKSLTQGLHSSMGELYFGDNNSTSASALGGSADGALDEIHLFNYVLTSAEVSNVKDDVTACVPPVVHHFEIIHDSSGSTCVAESVTIKACATADCSSLVTSGAVSVDFQGNSSTISSQTFTGSTTFTFDHITAETLTLSVASTSIPDNVLVCDDGSGTSCDIVFDDSNCSDCLAATNGIYGEAELQIGTGVTINGNSINSGDTTDNSITSSGATDNPSINLTSLGSVTFGSTDVTWNDGSYTAGSYKTVFVPEDAVITMAGGDYYVDYFDVSKRAIITLLGPVTIHVGKFDLADDVEMNGPYSNTSPVTSSGDAGDLVINWYGGGTADNKFHIHKRVKFTGLIYSPGIVHSEGVKFHDDAKFFGGIYTGNIIKTADDTEFTFGSTEQTAAGELFNCNIGGIDHYQISHGGNGLTCEAEIITIKACTNSFDGSCTQSSDAGSYTLKTVGASNTVTEAGTFTNGVGTVNLNYTNAEAVTLSLEDLSPAATNGYVCNDDSADSCNLTFADAEFRFLYGSGTSETIANQVSGNAFADTLRLQAVQSVDGVCEGLFTGNIDVNLAQENANPTGTDGLNFQINTNDIISKYPTYTTNVSLNFGADSIATIPTPKYLDAGEIRLRASYSDGANLIGSSQPFWVRPDHFVITAKSAGNDINGSNASSPTIHKAGAAFDLVVTAENSQNNTTQNYQQGQMQLKFTRVLPTSTGSVEGVLTYASGQTLTSATSAGFADHAMTSFSVGTAGVSEFSGANIDEVGLFSLDVQDLDYGGQGLLVEASEINIGRFIPAKFVLTAQDVENGCNDFTYMEQPNLTLTYEIEPQNTSNIKTQNYLGSFIHSTVNFVAENSDNATDLVGRLDDYSSHWSSASYVPADGNIFNEDVGNFSRDSLVDGPYDNLIIGIALDDGEVDGAKLEDLDMRADTTGVCTTNYNGSTDSTDCTAKAFTSTASQIRFGRWQIENTYGPESESLPVAMTIQQWDGSSFITNVDENCITPSITSEETSGAIWSGGLTDWQYRLVDLDGSDSLGVANTSASLSGTIVNGEFNTPPNQFIFSAPNNSEQGPLQFEYQVPTWLQYDWEDDGNFDENPTGLISFGLFRGNDRIISWREVGN